MSAPSRIRRILVRFVVVCVSLLVSLVLVEMVLRVTFPRYQYAAESALDFDSLLIWSRKPDTAVDRQHPDNGTTYQVHYNNLALRQGRDISEEELQKNRLVSIFGDSFTENVRMKGQYVFSEVLDFLENRSGEQLGSGTTVLNYGVDGYGTDQCYLRYSSLQKAANPDYVFYVFCKNDVRNIYENGLLRADETGLQIDDKGEPRTFKRKRPGWFKRFLSELYLTYFLRESMASIAGEGADEGADEPEEPPPQMTRRDRAKDRKARVHDARADEIQRNIVAGDFDAIQEFLDVFLAILEVWRDEVEERGGKFCIVLLPTRSEAVDGFLKERGYEVLNLEAELREMVPGFQWRDIQFKNDLHWNERGNMLAAVAIHNYLRRAAGKPELGMVEAAQALAPYYGALGLGFDGAPVPEPADESLRDAIRARYLELDSK